MKRIWTVFAIALLLAPLPAAAQGFITPFVGFNFGGDAKCPEISWCEEKTTNFVVAVGTLCPVIWF